MRASSWIVASQLVDLLDDDVVSDLCSEDPTVAIKVYFKPLGVRSLPAADFLNSDCSTDGFYDAGISKRPWILYSADQAAARVRFTLLHELGHHLLVNDGQRLLDDIDMIAGPTGDASRVEEAVCHGFAGRVLVSDQLLEEVIGDERLRPHHIESLHERSNASWEAVAVRAVEACDYKAAAVLIRNEGVVGFSAGSSRMGWSWWRRGARLSSGGPLAKALRIRQTALPETYRDGLGFAESMFCDTLPVHGGLAIAVLSDRPSDGHFEILDTPEPAWKEREEFCTWCGEERTVGWCDVCSGRRCNACDACGCSPRRANPVCPECFLAGPIRPGSRVCVTCEEAGIG